MMLDSGAFQLRPDTPVQWASGAVMPVYNDNRRLLSEAAARALVADAFVRVIEERGERLDGIVGTATGGIAPATTLADRLGLRFYYVRSAAKTHGLGRRVEGSDDDFAGTRVVLVEDAVSTGGSFASAAAAVHDADADLRFGLCVFSYGFAKADETFRALPFEFEVIPVVTFRDLFSRAEERELLTPDQSEEIGRWVRDPFNWASSTPEEQHE
jgi:orotate phosphoribosyltransferase